MRRINYKILVVLVLLLGLAGAGAYGLRRYFVGRNAAERLRQADAAQEAGQPKKAAEYLGQYLALRPGDTEAMARYGQLLDTLAASTKERLRAMLVLEQVLRREPTREDVRRRVVDIALSEGFKRYKDARYHLEILLKSHPDDGKLLAQLGLCQESEEQWEQAVKSYQKAVEKSPDRVDGYVSLARVLRGHAGDPARADKVMDDLVAANPKSGPARLERARYHDKVGRDAAARGDAESAGKRAAAARADLAEARKLTPEDADVLLESARLATDGEEPRAYLVEGLKHHPEDPRMYRSLAAVDARAGRDGEAIEQLEAGVKRLPESIELRFLLAELLVEAGRLDDAEGHIKGLRNAPSFRKEMLDYLDARVLAGRGRWREAADILGRVASAVEDLPEVSRAAFGLLGQCYREIGDVDQAQGAYRRALGVDPSWIPARLGLADSLAGTGRLEEAIGEYRALERVDPGIKVAIARLALMQAMRAPAAERRWEAVEKALDEAEQAVPDSVELPILRAEMLASRRDFDGAKAVLERARDAKPEHILYWTALAGLARAQGDHDGALGLLDQAETRVGDAVELRLARIQILADRGGPEALPALAALAGGLDDRHDAATARLLDALGMAYLRLGERGLAEQYLARLAKERPDAVGTRIILFDLALLADDAAKMQEQQKAIRDIEGEDGIWWRLTEVSRRMAVARRDGGDSRDFEAIRRNLSEIAARRPNWIRVALLEAELAELEGDTTRAIAGYQRAQELGDRQPRVAQELARLLYLRGRFEDADRAIRVLFQGEQSASDDAKRLAAEISLQTADPQRALALARETVSPDSSDFRDQIWLGRMLLESKRTAEAEAAFRRALELAPSEPEPWLALTVFLARERRLDEAKAVVRDAEAKLPPPRAPLALARCYEAIGLAGLAERNYKSAVEAEPRSVEALRSLVGFYERQGRLTEAEPYLRTLIDPETRALASDVATSRRTLALALTLAAKGDPEILGKALKLLDQNLSLVKDDPEDARLKALLLASQPGSGPKAIELFERLDREKPLGAGERFLLAQLHEAQGHWTEYRTLMLALLSNDDGKDPQRPAYLASYVASLIRQKALGEARVWLSKLEQAEPDSLRTVRLKADLLEKQGRSDEAIALLQAFSKKHGDEPKLAEAASNIAMSILYRSEADDAKYRLREQELTEGLKRSPRSLSYRFDMANLRTFQGKFSEAEGLYRQLLDEDQSNVSLLNNVAWVIALQGGRGDEAIELIDRALAQSKDNPELLDTRGFIRLTMDQPGPARDDLEKAVAKAPSAQLPRFHLAQAYLKLDEPEKARAAFEAAKGLGLDSNTLHPMERLAYKKLADDLSKARSDDPRSRARAVSSRP